MILYLIKSTLLLGVLLALYKLLLENEKMHRFNRLYLIMALVLGFTAPLISIEITSNSHIAGLEMETLNKVVNEPTQRVSQTIQKAITASTPIQPSAVESMEETSSSRSFPILPILWGVYGVVLGLLLIRFIAGLIQIRINIKKSELDQFSQATLVLMDTPITPQSFLHYIFLNKQEYQSGKVGSEILEHEYTHVRQLHSVDVMFIELLKLLFWFNPLLYLYKHAIQLNHEFLADEYVVNNVTDISNYQKKLIEVCEVDAQTPVTSHFSASTTKNRIKKLLVELNPIKSGLKILFITAIVGLISPACINLNSDQHSEETIEDLVYRLQQKIDEKDELSNHESQSLFHFVNSLEQVTDSIKNATIAEEAIRSLEPEYSRQLQKFDRLVSEYQTEVSGNSADQKELEEKYFLINSSYKILMIVHAQLSKYATMVPGETTIPDLPKLPVKS